MNDNFIWDLTKLFANDDAFYDEIENINQMLQDIDKFKNQTFDSDILLKVLNLKWLIKEKAFNILVYASLNYYKDIKSDKTKLMKDVAEKLNTKIKSSLAFIDEKIIFLGEDVINDYLASNKNLEIYEYYLNNIFRLRNHLQNDLINSEIEGLTNEINQALTKYNDLSESIDLGVITTQNEEVQLSLSNINKYLSSRNRETRKQAYLQINTAYKKQRIAFAQILNSIYQKRVKISELEKYSSVSKKALFQSNIDPLLIDNLINGVHNNLEVMRNYLKLKANALQIDEPHLFDYGVPFDNGNKKHYPLNNVSDIILEALMPLGEEYLKVAKLLISNNHIDAVLDENKHQSIIFSWETFSFINYRDAYNDLKYLIHELGHIVKFYFSKQKQPFIYGDHDENSIFVGEVGSLVNELLLNHNLYHNSQTNEEKLFYLSQNIESYFIQVFNRTMHTELENILYHHVKNGVILTADLLDDEYMNLLKKYYGKDTIYDDCASSGWTRLGHLFRWSYYVYNYAIGLITAGNIIDKIENDESVVIPRYLDFLAAGSNNYSLNLLMNLGIDLTEEEIINNSFNVLKNDVEKFRKILEKK